MDKGDSKNEEANNNESVANGLLVNNKEPATGSSGISLEKNSNDSLISESKKVENLQKALEFFKLAQQNQALVQPKTVEDAKKKKFEFWETQPVPKITEEISDVNEPIDTNEDVSKVRKEGLPLPDGFVWTSIDIDNENEVKIYFCLLFHWIIFISSFFSLKNFIHFCMRIMLKMMTTCFVLTIHLNFFVGF